MKKLTAEDVQELICLTPRQQKAWDGLVKAVKLCKKEKIWFYQVLETLSGLNGNNVKDVRCEEDRILDNVPDFMFDYDTRCLNGGVSVFNGIYITCSFADDNHFIQLKTD